MVPPRFVVPPLPCQNIVANAGIDLLLRLDQRIDFAPRLAQNIDPSSRPMPTIHAAVVDRCCGSLRRIWNCTGRCASWLLYLDLLRNEFTPFLPPQFCSPTDVRLNCTFPCCEVPPPTFRLAGSITSCPYTDTEELAGRVPVFDGIHFFLAPQLWMSLTTFFVIGGRSYLVPPSYAIREDARPEDPTLSQRLFLIGRL